MSLLRDYQFRELTSFGGAWLLQDPSTVPVTAALSALNMEYVSGMVGNRHGFAAARAAASTVFTLGALVELYCWYAPISQISSAYSDSLLVGARISSSTDVSLLAYTIKGSQGYSVTSTLTAACAGATFLGVGMRLYAAYYDATQKGLTQGGVIAAYNNTGAVGFLGTGISNLFLGPSTYTPGAPTEPGAGVITAGTHRLGYLIEYSSGFTTRVSPDPGTASPTVTTFVPITKVAAGSKNMAVTITNTWSSEVVAISLVMTTVTNLNQYYIVPGTRTAVSASFTITFDISDADLSSQGIDATPYLYWFTQWATAGGAATTLAHSPFALRHLVLLGDRMGYFGTATDNKSNTVDALYVSERNNYQAITSDQHLIQLPGQRPMTTAFRMGGLNYIVGPHEISAVADNGDVPATWAAPALVDGRHGTLATHGAEVSPSGNYAWIADQSGLYVFTGSPITALPMSYQQTTDWNRINWGAAYCVKIKDDASTKRVRVMAALDGATTPNYILTFDYTNGVTWDAVMYSLDSIGGSYTPGAMELVRNDLAGQATGNPQKIELWLGSSTAAASVLRQLSDADTNPFRDNGAGPSNFYRTCPLPGRDQAGGVISLHHGIHLRVKGSGQLQIQFWDIDRVRSFTGRTITLSATPDQDVFVAADLRGELAFVEFQAPGTDAHFQIAYLKYYHSPYLMQR